MAEKPKASHLKPGRCVAAGPAAQAPARYVLRLFVTGSTPNSIRAIANLRRICAEHIADNCDLEVVDLYQQPELAEGNQIVAAPTLIKKMPPPARRFVGDMSDTARVLSGLDIQPAQSGIDRG